MLGLRHAADLRTLLWLALMPAVAIAQYACPELIPYLWPLSFYLGLSAAVIAHNHNHGPLFENKRLSRLVGHYISLWNGYPTFAWVPTHNLNHHKFVNKAGDATITWRYTNKHHLGVVATYFFVSSWFQSDPIKTYIRKARAQNKALYRQIIGQYVFWASSAVATCLIAIWLHGASRGLWVWFAASVAPCLYSLWGIMAINYLQHVHTDPWSPHDHSRNFTGPLLNFLLFNNGYHAAHHENPGCHWTKLPEAHSKIVAEIHPSLNVRNAPWFLFKQYVLAPFFPRLGTRQLGRAPFDPPAGGAVDVATADVPLGEAGTNASMA
jgi:fatty acid desaturase